MGVRVFTDASRFTPIGDSANRTPTRGFRTKGVVSAAHRFEAIYDGTAGQEGLPTTLAGNICWIDISNLVQEGTNLNLTIQNMGAATCLVEAANAPRGWAQDPKAWQVTYMTGKWQQIAAALTTGQTADLSARVFSLLQLTFTANAAGGSIILMSN